MPFLPATRKSQSQLRGVSVVEDNACAAARHVLLRPAVKRVSSFCAVPRCRLLLTSRRWQRVNGCVIEGCSRVEVVLPPDSFTRCTAQHPQRQRDTRRLPFAAPAQPRRLKVRGAQCWQNSRGGSSKAARSAFRPARSQNPPPAHPSPRDRLSRSPPSLPQQKKA